MTEPQNIVAIEHATRLPWTEWKAWLDTRGAANCSHAEIAKLAKKKLAETTTNPGWWAQTIAVAYEQAIGRRVPGQRIDGTFDVSVSTTVSRRRNDAVDRVRRFVDTLQQGVREVKVESVRQSETSIRSYIRMQLSDATMVAWAIESITINKTRVIVTHTKLLSRESADEWRAYWKQCITEDITW